MAEEIMQKIMDKSSFKVGDEVVFTLNGIRREGVVFIVDAYGTFERPRIPSYDILVESENMLYKHVAYDMVCKK